MEHDKRLQIARNIYIHNLGIVNKIYLSKSESHARASLGVKLPVNLSYFLESYEYCLKLFEWLEREFNGIWPSTEYEEREKKQGQT